MEVLAHYGTPAQQERWLQSADGRPYPLRLLDDRAAVASSDATNIQCEIRATATTT